MGESEIQDHYGLCIESEASLGCMKHCLKTENNAEQIGHRSMKE